MKDKLLKKITGITVTLVMCLVSVPLSFADKSEKPQGYVTMSVEKFTIGQGYIKEPVKVPFYEGDSVAHLITRLLGNGNYTNTGSVGDTSGNTKKGFYLASVRDGKSKNNKSGIPQYIMDEIEKNEAKVRDKRITPEFLGEFDYTNKAGWMYCVNNWFPNYGSSVYEPKDGDVIRWQFTTFGLGLDIGGGMKKADSTDASNFQGSYKPIANKDKLTEKIAKINSSSDKDKILSNNNVQKAYNLACRVLEDVESSQSKVDNTLSQLKDVLDGKEINISSTDLDKSEDVNQDVDTDEAENDNISEENIKPNPDISCQKPAFTGEKLVGNSRYETAVKVSNSGWNTSENIVIVNGAKIPDALAATPFAKQIDAPILLTETEKLNESTKSEIQRLKAEHVFIIGGEGVVSNKVKNDLQNLGMKVERIAGSTRFETSLEIAKKLVDKVSISEIAVVNGEKGLCDATSIAAVAANKNMPILLMPTKGTNIYDNFIKDNNVSKTYIIGQSAAISKEIENKLPNCERIGGIDRNETNAKIVSKFYEGNDLSNVFVCKNGSVKENQLIDALSVGVLAAKENSPVVIVGNQLSNTQINVLKTKKINNITQIGGGCEGSFNEIKGLY